MNGEDLARKLRVSLERDHGDHLVVRREAPSTVTLCIEWCTVYVTGAYWLCIGCVSVVYRYMYRSPIHPAVSLPPIHQLL